MSTNTGVKEVAIATILADVVINGLEVIDIDLERERAMFKARHSGVKFVPVKEVKTDRKVTRSVLDNVKVVIPVKVNGMVCLAGYYESGQVHVLRPDGVTMKFNTVGKCTSEGISTWETEKVTRCRYYPASCNNQISYERAMLLLYGIMLDVLPENIDEYEVNSMDYSGSIKERGDKKIEFNFNLQNLEWCEDFENQLHRTLWEALFKWTGKCNSMSIYPLKNALVNIYK